MSHRHARPLALALAVSVLAIGPAAAESSSHHRANAHRADGRYTTLSAPDAVVVAPSRRGYPYVGYNAFDPSTYPAAGIDLPSPANLTPND